MSREWMLSWGNSNYLCEIIILVIKKEQKTSTKQTLKSKVLWEPKNIC